MLRIKVGNRMVGLKQLSPDDIGSLRRTKSSEMSTFVQCNNHAHSIHNKKKVDLWYKEQNINVGKLGRGQQVMYRQLLKVHSEKKRNRKKKYIQQQELIRQQLREKAALERHQTALEANGINEGKSGLPEVLSDIGEEVELEIGDVSEGEDKKQKTRESTGKNGDETVRVGDKTVNDGGQGKAKQDIAKGANNLTTPEEKRDKPKRSRRRMGTVSLPEQITKPEPSKMDSGVQKTFDNPRDQTDSPQSVREDLVVGESNAQVEDNIIDVVSKVNKESVDTNAKTNGGKRKEKRVQEQLGLLPKVSLTTSYLTHGAPREWDEEADDDGGDTQTEKKNGRSRKVSKGKRERQSRQNIANSADRLPEIVSRRGSEAQDSSVLGTSPGKKGKEETMINISRFTRFTNSVRIPSNVYIPRVSRVVRYHRNTQGSLVSSEVSLKPVEDDYKLPSTKEAYFIKKALDREKEKTQENERRLQDFYSKMEAEVKNRVSVMARPIQSPTKEVFGDSQPKLGFSASLLTHMRHTTIEGDVHDLRNCKYLRFHEILSPEQRELYRRKRLSSWGKHGTVDPKSLTVGASRRELSRSYANTY
ncbi:uncharacterized protein [Ptychodera flava]|uniref:uncharacterized protein n=1 Tax=Ptychodera flava TaxID=63121 RepID=UPI00396A500B